MDDASSISSGEISDAVAGVSTDDNITVGSSLSAHSFSADHRAAAAAGLASQRAAVLRMVVDGGGMSAGCTAGRTAAVLRMGSVTLHTARRGQAAVTERSNAIGSQQRATPTVTAGPAGLTTL